MNGIRTLLQAGILAALATVAAQAQIIVDGRFDDWPDRPPLHADPAGDAGSGEVDFGRLWITHDQTHLYLRLEIGVPLSLQGENPISLFLDADNDARTGLPVHGIGAELVWRFGRAPGTVYLENGDSLAVLHPNLGLVTAPTVVSDRFEICLDRTVRPTGRRPLFRGSRLALVLAADGDLLPDAGQRLEYHLDEPGEPVTPPGSVARPGPDLLRVMTYNTWRNGPFDPKREPAFRRLLQAIGPDLAGFEEIRDHGSDEVAAWMGSVLGGTFHHARVADNVAVSRYPIIATFPVGDNGAFLLDLEPRQPSRLLFVVAHPPCCLHDQERQAEIDELMAFVRTVQREGERFDLPAETPIVIVGDMNLVGLPGQLATLVRGEIADTVKHGPAFAPDWDGTSLADLSPRHLASPHTFTWYSGESSFTPGRLDYLVFTDSVLEAVNGFVLHTPELPVEVLAGLGLKAEDTETASDHLPVVADLAFRRKKALQ